MIECDDTKNFYFLVEICGGIMEAYNACEKYGGIHITIPKKEHKRVVAKELLKIGVSCKEIANRLHISKRNVAKIKKDSNA